MPTINEDHAIILATALAEDLGTLLKRSEATKTITTDQLYTVQSRLSIVRQIAPEDENWVRILSNLQTSITTLEGYDVITLGEKTRLIDPSRPYAGYGTGLPSKVGDPHPSSGKKPLSALELGRKLVDAAATAEAARAAAREARAAETPAATVSRNVRGGT